MSICQKILVMQQRILLLVFLAFTPDDEKHLITDISMLFTIGLHKIPAAFTFF